MTLVEVMTLCVTCDSNVHSYKLYFGVTGVRLVKMSHDYKLLGKY